MTCWDVRVVVTLIPAPNPLSAAAMELGWNCSSCRQTSPVNKTNVTWGQSRLVLYGDLRRSALSRDLIAFANIV